jgi:hypothetical protein
MKTLVEFMSGEIAKSDLCDRCREKVLRIRSRYEAPYEHTMVVEPEIRRDGDVRIVPAGGEVIGPKLAEMEFDEGGHVYKQHGHDPKAKVRRG